MATDTHNTADAPRGKVLQGTVVSCAMEKTAVVAVDRYVRHAKYGKFIRRRKKYKVHDPENQCAVGETVRIREIPRRSKDTAFALVQ